MSFELRQLRHVLALAEHGSFARAAVALHLSQPALSRSVQSFERHVGTTLFVRSGSGVVPTDFGRLLIQRARQITELANDLSQQVLARRTLETGHVTIGGGPYPVESTLSAALARFISEHPMVNVRLQVRDWDELLRRLRARELDFFVAEISTMLQEHDLDIEPMSAHPLYFIARKGHPLAGRTNVTTTDIFAFPSVTPNRIPPRVLAPLLAAQRKSPDPVAAQRAFPSLECNAMAAIKRIVAGSDAIMAATLSSITAELDSGQLTILPGEPWLSAHYGLVKLKGHPLSYASEAFREFVIEAEGETVLEEQRLLAQWMPATRRSRAPRSRKRSPSGRGSDTGKPGTKRPAAGL
jgi:DNA-binding transcriptional LysR family regulator